MENKDIIIIASIVVIIYLYYQQQQEYNQSPHIIESPNTQQLRSELNHYQSLYQKRVQKDLDAQTLNSEWETRYNQLESLNNQTNREKNELAKYQVLIEKKVEDLETQLLNLAKQKIKGKKDAERLLTNLETQWNQDKENWQQNQQILHKLQEFHHLVEKSPSHSLDRNQVNEAEKLIEQITQPEIKQLASWMITDSAFILGHNNLLTKLATQEDKLEETREQIKLLTQKNQDLTEELKAKREFYQGEIKKFSQLRIDLEQKETIVKEINENQKQEQEQWQQRENSWQTEQDNWLKQKQELTEQIKKQNQCLAKRQEESTQLKVQVQQLQTSLTETKNEQAILNGKLTQLSQENEELKKNQLTENELEVISLVANMKKIEEWENLEIQSFKHYELGTALQRMQITAKQIHDLFKQKKEAKQQLTNQLEKNQELQEENEKLKELVDVDLLQKLEQEKQLITQGHNEQLKKINTLFDPTANDYKTIDFNGLYSLLQQIAERERERQ